MEAKAEHQKTKNFRMFYSITTAIGLGVAVLLLYWILHYRGGFAWTSNPSHEFYWHPLLMFLGMIFLYSQSMLVYRTCRYSPKKKLKLVHAALHLLAFILSVIGLQAVFDSHNLIKNPIPNLYSLHSWIGLITVIIFAAQFLAGFVTFLYPGLTNTIRAAVMPVHTAFGIGCFVLALISAMTGLTEKVLWTLGAEYPKFVTEGVLYNIIALSIALYGVLVLYLVNETDYKRIALPEDQIALASSN